MNPYTTTDAARLLGVSPRRIRQYIATGRLTATKVGGSLVVDAASVDHFEPLPTGNPHWHKGADGAGRHNGGSS